MRDMREVAQVLQGRRVAAGVRMLVVPGSEIVKREAEAEGGRRGQGREVGHEGRRRGEERCAGCGAREAWEERREAGEEEEEK